MARLTGEDVTIFTIGGTNNSYIGELQEVEYEITNGDEDESGINEVSEDPCPVSRARQITGTCQVEDTKQLVLVAESANPIIAFNMDMGGVVYSGSGLLTRVNHSSGRKRIQRETFTIKVKGTPTVTLVA